MGDIYDKEPASTSDLIRGYHYWGYITSRKHSLEQRAALDPYYQIVKDVDYSYRPSARIIEWYRTLGIEAGFCSQDAARAYVTALRLKRARLNTRLAFATVRAVAGEHGSEDFINGLARAARGTTAHAATLSIDDAAVLGILRAQQAEAREPTPSNIAPRLPRWERKMLTPESIEWCYRIFLGRDPEPGAIEAHMGGQMSLGEFRDQTMASDEFRRRQDLQ
jgi:hypothetical protein